MSEVISRRELGRGERVLPGVFRLRLPLPWPGVPHCNAWALTAGDGFVLFDTGMYEPDSMANLERALAMCHLRLQDTRLIVCTHAHSDHCGQAAAIQQLAGCELWMHPDHGHIAAMVQDPDAVFARRLEIARQSGVPEEPLRRYAAERRAQRSAQGSGFAGPIEPDRELVDGVIVRGRGRLERPRDPWTRPRTRCLFQGERRLLISGDHLLGRISLYFDYGYSPDPVGEFLNSLTVVERLRARLCLPGHGRTFADVQAHLDGNRTLVHKRLASVLETVEGHELTAFEVVPHVYGGPLERENAHWLLSKVLAYLTHLQASGRVRRLGGDPERWTA